MRRRRRYALTCSHPGCDRREWFDLLPRRERVYERKKWNCPEHHLLNERLLPGVREKVQVTLVSKRLIEGSEAAFWVPTGSNTGSGYSHGPKCHFRTEDWPLGTKIIITYEAIAPDPPNHPGG